MFKIRFSLNSLSSFLLYLSILVFIIGFNFSDNRSGGWYQQFLPDLNGRVLTDITFLDSLTGFAVTDGNSTNNGFILKTTNGGDNWTIKHSQNVRFNKVQFVNSTTGFVDAYVDLLFKTTNAGENWFTINLPEDLFSDDMWVLNEDTIWLAQIDALVGGLFRTTNGGQNWIRQYYVLGNNPNKIYMFNKDIGFMFNEKDSLLKTTNSGVNWFRVSGGAFSDIQFVDSLNGWKTENVYFKIKNTTDGGLNWLEQTIPHITGQFKSGITDFHVLNKDSLWGSGGIFLFNNSQFKGTVFKTTNSGINWGMQFPDSSIHIQQYDFIDFTDKLIGWSYTSIPTGIHTVTGGLDSTIYLGINQKENVVRFNFILNQNYPNPFNPVTIINYELRITNFIKLKVYDILGNEIQTLVNQKQNSGSYKVEFDGNSLPSGVYFYSLIADGIKIDTKKMILVR